VILAKTIKGWTLGRHRGPQLDPPDQEDEHQPAAHFARPVVPERGDSRLALEEGEPPYFRPAPDSIEYEYMMERRRSLGGPLPSGSTAPSPPPRRRHLLGVRRRLRRARRVDHHGVRRLLRNCFVTGRGLAVVPIIPDEARTFGLDGLFRDVKIYSPIGQLYDPVDSASC